MKFITDEISSSAQNLVEECYGDIASQAALTNVFLSAVFQLTGMMCLVCSSLLVTFRATEFANATNVRRESDLRGGRTHNRGYDCPFLNTCSCVRTIDTCRAKLKYKMKQGITGAKGWKAKCCKSQILVWLAGKEQC
jgi:hypothetical protein